MRTGGNGDYGVEDMSNVNPYQAPQSTVSSYATRGHSSLPENGHGDGGGGSSGYHCAPHKNQGYGGTGHGDQYSSGTASQQPKRNDTSTSLRGSPQLDMRTDNGFNSSQESRHHVSRALPRNYGIDSHCLPHGRLGGQYGQDREKMKEELAHSNSMARNGSGILPGGILQDRGAPLSHAQWKGTRSDTNSSIHQPEKYSTRSETILTPTHTTGAKSGINGNTRVSSLIADAEATTSKLRYDLSECNNQFQGRVDSFTRPTASWNSVGMGGFGDGRMTMADLEKERQLSGARRLKQDAYRADLERQVEQKNRTRMEEERRWESHPLGHSYEQPKPTFWQSSMKARANCPQDISPQKRLLVQNSSTRVSQYEVPCTRVTQALTNLQNSRISPDTYHSQPQHHLRNAVGEGGVNGMRNQNLNTTFLSQQQHLSSENAKNFRAHSSPFDEGDSQRVRYPPKGDVAPNMRPVEKAPFRDFRQEAYQQRPVRPPQPQFVPYYGPQPPPIAPYPFPYPHPVQNPQYPGYPPPAYPYSTSPPFAYPPMNPPQGYPPIPIVAPYSHPHHMAQFNAQPQSPRQRPMESSRSSPRRFNLEEIEQQVSKMQNQLDEEDEAKGYSSRGEKTHFNPLKPTQSMFSDIDRLKDFVEAKLFRKSVDFDELRENVFGRPNNWKTTETALDLKPIKDLINRAELAQQIKTNKMKKAMQAAKEQEEEEKLERKIHEYNRLQKTRDGITENNKAEWIKAHNSNKKSVSHDFVVEEERVSKSKRENEVPYQAPRKRETPKKRVQIQQAPEDPERTLAKKIRHRSRSGVRFEDQEDQDEFAGGDQGQFDTNNSLERDTPSSYSYVELMENYNRNRVPSPPIPTLLPKNNEETLTKKLKCREFFKPRLSPSMIQVPDLRARIAMEKRLKGKISAASF